MQDQNEWWKQGWFWLLIVGLMIFIIFSLVYEMTKDGKPTTWLWVFIFFSIILIIVGAILYFMNRDITAYIPSQQCYQEIKIPRSLVKPICPEKCAPSPAIAPTPVQCPNPCLEVKPMC